MSNALALTLIVAGLVLFVIGDLLWLARHTLNRPMNVRVTGGFVAGGVALMLIGMAGFAFNS